MSIYTMHMHSRYHDIPVHFILFSCYTIHSLETSSCILIFCVLKSRVHIKFSIAAQITLVILRETHELIENIPISFSPPLNHSTRLTVAVTEG